MSCECWDTVAVSMTTWDEIIRWVVSVMTQSIRQYEINNEMRCKCCATATDSEALWN